MKRFLSLLLVFALVLSCTPMMPIQAQAATGEQSAFEGYTPVSNKEELDAIRNDLSGKYYLTADIVFSDEDFAEGGAFYNDGAKWVPIGTSSAPFRGVFDGNGHTITGLSVLVEHTENAVGGLFGYVSSSNSEYGIFNLGMISDYILVSNASGTSYAGSVAGYCETGKIEGCYHTGHVAATNTSGEIYAGGIVGYKQYGQINKCYNTGSVVGGGITGGIVGGTTYASVSNCYNNTEFDGKYAGGIVGSASFGTVDTCYSLGTNSSSYGSGFAGGIVGMNSNCTVTNCYYTSNTASGGGTKKTASAMQNQSTFSGFDFTNTWTMDGNSDYPYPELQGVTLNYTRTLTSISVSACPTKTTYVVNEESLDVTGGVITQTYNDGSTSTVAMTIDMVSGFDNTVLGEQTLSVEHEGMSATFVIQIITPKPKVVHVEITSLPNKLVYIKDVDTNIVTNGGQLTATYDDGSTMIVTIAKEMISGVDFTIEGTQNVTIVYEGVTTTYEINILAENTAEFAGGKGTETSPYLISNTTHLSNIKLYPSAHYALTQDIRFTDSEQWDGLETFLGVLDGNGFKIYNLNSNSLVDTNAGKIKNLGCYEVNIANKTSRYLGVIASTNNGEIYRCYVTGNLYSEITGGSYTAIYIGGIAGYNCGKIIECCSNMNIVGHFISNDEKINYLKRYIGGISGFGYNGNIENCYSLGAINATEQCDNCWWRDNTTYSYEGVSGGGSEVNLSYSDVIINNSHSRVIVGNNGETVVGTIEELQSKENYVGFDFTSVWVIGMSEYPMPSLRGMTTFGPQAENTTDFLAGNGSQFSPYLISNYSHLCNISKYLNANFLVVCDIVVPKDALNWKPIGTAELPFSGVFDGGGYIISGCVINTTEDDGIAVGFFGNASGCEIRNISFANGNTTANIEDAVAYAGTVVGNIEHSVVENCHNFQSISLTTRADSRATGHCGGIVGSAYDTRIIACTNSGIVSSHTSASEYQSVHVYDYVGGIVATGGTIEQCTNMGECSSFVGAYITGSITPYYASMTADAYIGGIAGTASNISDCKNSGVLKSETLKKMTRSDYNDEPEKGSIWCGGIVAKGGTVQRCYNTGSNLVGKCSNGRNAGISGTAHNISDCFNVGILKYTSEGSGQKAGIACTANEITTCYSLYYPLYPTKLDIDSNPYCYDYFGYGAPNMLENDPYNQTTYEGFDFDSVWSMGRGEYPYPVLDEMQIPWELNEIAIHTLPDKIEYLVNVESLDLSNAKIVITRNGITSAEILPITTDMVSTFDNTIIGCQTIIVAFHDMTTSFTVEIVTEDKSNYAGGIGSKEYPYIIETEEHLKNVMLNPCAHFVLANDIALTTENWVPIQSFGGMFEGNGHTISGLSITFGDGDLGLFATNSGTIYRLGVVGEIIVNPVTGATGGIVGSNSGTIYECFSGVNISVSAKTVREYDYSYGGYITTPWPCFAGGIAGENFGGTIMDCYNYGNVSATTFKGGLYDQHCGDAIGAGITAKGGTVGTCYNIGLIEAYSDYSSEYAEMFEISMSFTDSYADSTDAMLCKGTYIGFDFKNIWDIDPFTDYPYPQFRWQLKKITDLSIVAGNPTIEAIEALWPDMSAVTVRATYADGSTKDIALVPVLLQELDINRVGTQTVHMTCCDITSEETVTFVIKEKEPATLEIKKFPNKLTYVQGQPLSLEDCVLTLTYSNKTTVDVNLLDAQLSYDINAIGTVPVTATYEGLTVSFDITVNERIVKSVVLTQPSKLSYIEGQELDLTGGIVTVTYVSDDNYSEQIPLEISMLSGYDKSIVGIQTITFNYLEHSETFVVRVVKNKVVSIAISQMPQKLEYNVCEETLDVTGGIITATMLDGSTKEIEMTESMVSGFDNAQIGTQTLTVNYEDVTTTYTVEISATVPDRVEIQTLPTKCYYFTGETLDLTGLALKAHYGEKTAIITVFDDVAEVDMTTAGIKEVSVTFQGIETVFSVYVHEEKTDVISVDSSLYPESSHNYSNNLNETKTFTYPGAVSLTITFNSQTSVESNYDYIYIYDGDGAQIAKYTGTTAANKILTIPGDSFKVKLTSDSSQVKYGYAFSSIKATTKGTIHPATIDPATATCTQTGLTEGSHCEICGMVLVAQEEMPALGHNYEASFSWNEDHSACTYVLTCSRCADVQTLACTIAVTGVTQQHTTHCATVEYEGQEYNDTFTCDHALITFKNWDGTQLSSVYYHVGEEITVPSNPTKAADNTYTYTFAGWDKEVVNCAGCATYTATYTSNYIDYTVVFKNWNGDVLSTKTYHYGDKVIAPAAPTKAADETYTYTFAGWDKEVVDCADNATYTATYTSDYIDYVVKFVDEDGTVISEKSYHYGDKVTAPTDPTKAADNTYAYTFAGWDKDVVDCAGDATYTATYNADYIDYVVKFVDEDGTVISEKSYHYGDKVTAPTDPTKAANKTYTYTFTGWDKTVVDCDGNATYTATYTSNYIDYVVKFVDEDGTVISEKSYHYGDKVTAPAVPTKAADNTYTYAFNGWDKEVVVCAGDATYTATYTSDYIDYTVVFKNWNGDVLSTKTYHYGDTAEVPANPTREANNTYTYDFSGWDKTVSKVTGDAVYTAKYAPVYISYTVIFQNHDGTVLSKQFCHYGDSVVAPGNPTRYTDETYTYAFAGWDSEVTKCDGDKVYTATYMPTYRDYIITFINYDGSVISEKTYHYGDTVTPPADPTRESSNTYKYTFSGWNNTVTVCTESKTYTAVYTPEYIDYTITFKNYDGTVISSEVYHYGDYVVAPTPTGKPADNKYTYNFAGWDSSVVPCNGNKEYVATYTPQYINYTVTFRYEDGTVIKQYTLHYGDSVAVPAAPAVPEAFGDDYEFSGWDKEVTDCQGNAVYTAVFARKYIIGDIDGDQAVTQVDAVYLLLHTMFGEMFYPLNHAPADIDGNGTVNQEDAVYLLLHTMFGEMFYPLNPAILPAKVEEQ